MDKQMKAGNERKSFEKKKKKSVNGDQHRGVRRKETKGGGAGS